MNKQKIVFFTIAFITFFLMGFFFNNYSSSKRSMSDDSTTQIREDSSEYKYVNPLLFASDFEVKYSELDDLQEKLEKYIDDKKNKNGVESVSVYFREMDSGKWTGIVEDDSYAPASMLKVVTLIAVLKKASLDPSILTQKKYYEYEDNSGQYYKSKPLQTGLYNVLTLLQQMIVYSDNTAMDLVDQDNILDIVELYKDLKLSSPIGSPENFMSPRSYSRFFRALYNATYLTRNYSEQALKLLTYTSFEKGLRQGVPTNIEISHKFGEYTSLEDGVIKYRELHDCGIIYHSSQPYLLCVMTKGDDFLSLEKIIGDISKIVFEYQKDLYER